MLSNNQLFNKVPFNSAFWMTVFSLPSIILTALLGNNFNGLKRSWFVICDWWISIRFVCFCVQGSLLVIVIKIDGSEKRNCEGGFCTIEFAHL